MLVFLSCPVDSECRSRMNVPIRLGSIAGDEDLEKKFLAEATKAGLVSLKGHRLATSFALLFNIFKMICSRSANLLKMSQNNPAKKYVAIHSKIKSKI